MTACSSVLFAGLLLLGARDTPWSLPEIPEIIQHPFPRIAANSQELERLRVAYHEDGASRAVIVKRIREADVALARPLEFPPRGGQHNQWYQCDDCQLALRTIDDTHHRCPRCGKVYSGEPYDDVIYSRKHSRNLQGALAAAWAYAITNENKYAQHTAAVLAGYAARYRDYPYHSASRVSGSWQAKSGGHLFEQTLTEASAMTSYIAPSYDLIRAGDVLTDEQDQLIRRGLLIPMLENIAKYRAGKSNWQTWHNAAMISAGAVLGDGEWVKRSICDPGNGFADQMVMSVSDDGMWYENSWGYHFYTLRAMIHIIEAARRLGIGLWGHPRLQRMFTVPIDYAMPNGRLPRFGDDVNTSMGSAAASLEFAYHAYRQKRMLSYLPQRPTWDSVMLGRSVSETQDRPPLKSCLFPAAGHAILRTGGPHGLASAITFGPYGGFHGHFDKLSFVLYAHGKELGVDPGRAASQAYRLPIHRNWYKATLSHNAVTVDGKSQSPATGQLLWFDARPQRAALAVRCTEAFDGVAHTRLLLQTQDYLLVLDDLQSQVPHRYAWFYHNRGKFGGTTVATSTVEAPEAEASNLEYIGNARQGTTNKAIRASFLTGEVMTGLTMDAQVNTELLIGDGVGASINDRVPLVRVTRQGATARFAAVLEPREADQPASVHGVSCRQQEGGLAIQVQRDTGSDRYVLDRNWRLHDGGAGR